MQSAIKMNICRRTLSIKQNVFCTQFKYINSIGTEKDHVRTSGFSGITDSLLGEQPKAYSEIPKISFWRYMKSVLPGGKYYNFDYAQLMNALCEEKGRIFLLPSMLSTPSVCVTANPNDFETIYRNEDGMPVRVGLDALHYHRSKYRKDFFQGVEGLIPSNGKAWSSFRSIVNPIMLRPSNVKLYLKRMSSVNKEFLERIREIRDPVTFEVPDTFEAEINRFTLETISTIALEQQLGLFKNQDHSTASDALYGNLIDFFKLSLEVNLKPSIWKYIPTKDFNRLMKVLDNILDITSGFVNEAIERLNKEKLNGIQRPEHEQSILEKLIKVDKQVATIMAMELFFGGVDSSSTVIAGTLMALAKNPDIQAKLRKEIRTILPRKDSEFNEHSLDSLPYLRACLKEGMRLYPFVLFNMRVPQKDIVLSGYNVPKNTIILMVFTNIFQHENYFKNANSFKPERWLRTTAELNNIDLKPRSPFYHTPFGFGARMCIGKRIVGMELELLISRIVRNFHIEFDYPIENAFKCQMVNLPNMPLKFKFKEVAD